MFFFIIIIINRHRLLTFLYKFHDSLSILHGIAFSSGKLRLEGEVGGKEPSTLLFFCLYQVDIIVIASVATRTVSLWPVRLLPSVLPLYSSFSSSFPSSSPPRQCPIPQFPFPPPYPLSFPPSFPSSCQTCVD